MSRTSQPRAGVGRSQSSASSARAAAPAARRCSAREVVEQLAPCRRRRPSASATGAAADGSARATTFTSAGCGSGSGPGREPRVAVLHDLVVDVVAEHQPQLGLHAPVHGLVRGERLRRLRAPPRELLAAFTPAVAAELGEHRRDRAVVFLVAVEGAQRQLPAHRGLGLAKCCPVFIACRCNAQPGPASKPGRLRKMHASLMQPGAPLVLARPSPRRPSSCRPP